GAFWIVSLLHEAWLKTGWTGTINAKVFAMKSQRNFSQQMHLIHPIGPYTHVLVRLVVFGCIWQCFVTIQNSVQNGLNWCNKCRSSCHEVVSEFFTINAPNPPHWTLNSCLCVSRSDWVYLAMFRYYTKLGAKWVELVQLMQKFFPRNRIGIFRNERT